MVIIFYLLGYVTVMNVNSKKMKFMSKLTRDEKLILVFPREGIARGNKSQGREGAQNLTSGLLRSLTGFG